MYDAGASRKVARLQLDSLSILCVVTDDVLSLTDSISSSLFFGPVELEVIIVNSLYYMVAAFF